MAAVNFSALEDDKLYFKLKVGFLGITDLNETEHTAKYKKINSTVHVYSEVDPVDANGNFSQVIVYRISV